MSAESLEALQVVLSGFFDAPIESITSERSRYSTSSPIDVIQITFASGHTTAVIRKDLAQSSLLPEARNAKPPFLHDPARELQAYAQLLPLCPHGTARYIGSTSGTAPDQQWLFLERLAGIELFQSGAVHQWSAAARWAARLHRTFLGRVEEVAPLDVAFLVHDEAWLRMWADRAWAHATRETVGSVRFIHSKLDGLVDRFTTLDRTVAHAEFYPSNVIVDDRCGETVVSPVDWEMVALAPGLIDLAALTTGIDALMRVQIESAYCEEIARELDDEFREELDACRLALCLQWLGWMPDWNAPREHATDWLNEALVLVDRLAL